MKITKILEYIPAPTTEGTPAENIVKLAEITPPAAPVETIAVTEVSNTPAPTEMPKKHAPTAKTSKYKYTGPEHREISCREPETDDEHVFVEMCEYARARMYEEYDCPIPQGYHSGTTPAYITVYPRSAWMKYKRECLDRLNYYILRERAEKINGYVDEYANKIMGKKRIEELGDKILTNVLNCDCQRTSSALFLKLPEYDYSSDLWATVTGINGNIISGVTKHACGIHLPSIVENPKVNYMASLDSRENLTREYKAWGARELLRKEHCEVFEKEWRKYILREWAE